MFWKSANYFRNASIAVRLSCLYAITSFVLLLTLCSYAYWALADTLYTSNQKFLNDEVRVIRNILQKHPENRSLLSEEVQWVPDELEASEYHYYARISDLNRTIFAVTERMSSIFQNVGFPEATPVNEIDNETASWTSPTGNKYLLVSALAKVGNTNSLRLIEIALDITPQQQIIEMYRQNLIIVFILGIIIATLLGIIITRRGMRSLNDITQYAAEISISDLKAINIKHCPNELRDLVNTFNKMLQRIENSYSRLSSFSNELAHELRTPINNLMGEAEIILSRERSPLEYKEVITSSLEEYFRLSRMIENILFLARTENPNAKMNFQPLDLGDEFQNLAESFDPLLNEKNITLNHSGNLKLLAEPNLLRRALSNLISNAIKYSRENGKISLHCSNIDGQNIITVNDNGIGIGEEHLPYIFNRFYRVKNEELSVSEGLGLGLAIVKSIMDLHKGKINLSSQSNEGTSIQLIFPVLI